MNYVNPFTGTHKAGNHAFRRFRNTYLRNYTECPEGLYKFWMGHAGKDMSDLYDKIKQDQRRRAVPQKMGQSGYIRYHEGNSIPNLHGVSSAAPRRCSQNSVSQSRSRAFWMSLANLGILDEAQHAAVGYSLSAA